MKLIIHELFDHKALNKGHRLEHWGVFPWALQWSDLPRQWLGSPYYNFPYNTIISEEMHSHVMFANSIIKTIKVWTSYMLILDTRLFLTLGGKAKTRWPRSDTIWNNVYYWLKEVNVRLQKLNQSWFCLTFLLLTYNTLSIHTRKKHFYYKKGAL
jgi:hypothetical protein